MRSNRKSQELLVQTENIKSKNHNVKTGHLFVFQKQMRLLTVYHRNPEIYSRLTQVTSQANLFAWWLNSSYVPRPVENNLMQQGFALVHQFSQQREKKALYLFCMKQYKAWCPIPGRVDPSREVGFPFLSWEGQPNVRGSSREEVRIFLHFYWFLRLVIYWALLRKKTEFFDKSSKTIDILLVFFKPKWNPSHIEYYYSTPLMTVTKTQLISQNPRVLGMGSGYSALHQSCWESKNQSSAGLHHHWVGRSKGSRSFQPRGRGSCMNVLVLPLKQV